MDGIKDDKPKSGWRIVRRIAAWLLILFLLAIGAGYIYLKSLPVPSPEVLAEADNQYRRTRALFPDAPTTATKISTPLRPAANSTVTTQSAQERCDKLFREIIMAERGDGLRHVAVGMNMLAYNVTGSIDKAKALAALYDKGVRVSPEVSAELMRDGGRNIIVLLAAAIIGDLQPGDTNEQVLAKNKNIEKLSTEERARRFERYTLALKLLRVLNAPVNDYELEYFMLSEQDRTRNIRRVTELDNLPPELLRMNIDLIAPRGPLDWNRCVAAHLDYWHDTAATRQSLLKAPNAFEFFKAINSKEKPENWYDPLLANAIGAGGAIVGPPIYIAPIVQRELEAERNAQAYAQSLARNEIDPSKISADTASVLSWTNEQISSRLLAADIELRRGGVVPAPDKIGPDSYFFDPIMQRPYKLYVKPDGKDWIYLCVRREIAPHSRAQGEKPVGEMDVTKIRLPVNHPGLERIPKQ